MAHKTQVDIFTIISRFYPAFFYKKKVLEVGSLNVNGSVRDFFHECEYVGSDVASGKDVDIATPGQLLEFPTNFFDVVISTECFEHNPFWIETFVNMLRMMKRAGMLIVTCASAGRGEHGTGRTTPENSPLTSQIGWEYYRNLTKRDFQVLNLGNWFKSYCLVEGGPNNDLILVAFGRDSNCQITEQFSNAVNNCMKYTFWSRFLAIVNKILGNHYFQELYVFVRKYVPFLLRSNRK